MRVEGSTLWLFRWNAGPDGPASSLPSDTGLEALAKSLYFFQRAEGAGFLPDTITEGLEGPKVLRGMSSHLIEYSSASLRGSFSL